MSEPLYIFIKAKDRLPAAAGKYLCKKIDTGENILVRFSGKIGKQCAFYRENNNIQWLELYDNEYGVKEGNTKDGRVIKNNL